MSIDLSRVTGISDSRGVITEIKDSLGRVIWAVSGGKVILEVEKITSDTYAGETTYTGEQFILLDIYPKTNGTVTVTYGGLTKTITDTSGAAEPNAQKVFFGTFNGVSDSVTTPESGKLTIDGDCVAFGCGQYTKTSKDTISQYCLCITAINSFGKTTRIPDHAFGGLDGCEKINTVKIPGNIKEIGSYAFGGCENIESVILGNGVLQIKSLAFYQCLALTNIQIPASVNSIEEEVFLGVQKGEGIVIDSENEHYKMDGNCIIEKNTNSLRDGFSDSIIPNYVQSIGRRAFFATNAESVTIPSGVTFIGNEAFSAMKYLTSVTILAITPPVLSVDGYSDGITRVFDCTDNPYLIIVPKGYGNAYKTADQWSKYEDRITEAT